MYLLMVINQFGEAFFMIISGGDLNAVTLLKKNLFVKEQKEKRKILRRLLNMKIKRKKK